MAAALAVALLAVSCSTRSEERAAAPESTTSSTTTLPTATWPFTGLTTTDLAVVTQPAVVAKMDNQPEARPQSGLNQADVVYELLIEGFTRFALVFHSQVGDPVGPIRSARSSDIDLLAALGDPVLAWSGGNEGVRAEVREAAREGLVVDASHSAASAEYWRSPDRRMPHNLYTNVSSLREAFGPESTGSPQPILAYRPPSVAAGGTPTPGVTVPFDGVAEVDYVWDPASRGWARFQVDQRHSRAESATLDADGVQVAPPNVVILFIDYSPSPSDPRSPMAITTGEGEAVVLTDGRLIRGSWARPTPSSGWTLLDAAGAPMGLTPGPTWIALPEAGDQVHELDAATAQEIMATRG